MIAGVVFLARSLVRRREPVAHDQDLLEREVPFVDEADDVISERTARCQNAQIQSIGWS